MKLHWIIAIGVAGFGLGLGTGVALKEEKHGAVTRELAALKAARATRAAERPAPEMDAERKAARRRQEEQREQHRQQEQVRMEKAQRVRALTEAALQLDDEKLRAEAIEKIRKALGSGDPGEVAFGLTAFNRLYELDFDKGSFRGLVLPHLENGDESLRSSAWSALMMIGLQPGDAERMRQVAKTMGMGENTSFLLFRMEKGDLTGESGEIVRGLLDPKDAGKSREVMRGTWGSKYSPKLEADLIALSREPAFLHDTVYYALSTQQNKSAATVARLIEVLGDSDSYNNGGRAAWGLRQGVSPELAPMVADAAVKIVTTRSSGYLAGEAWSLLELYAGPSHLASMQSLAAKPGLPEDRRAKVNALIEKISAGAN